jgi:uncharacterized protein (DUF608 family)
MNEHPPRLSCGQSADLRVQRREFLKQTSFALAGLAFSTAPAMAGPFDSSDFEKLVPRDKKLTEAWLRSLTARGEPEVFSGSNLGFIGMPVGGIACGQLHLAGDGRLWYWDIFHSNTSTDYEGKVWAGPKYAQPLTPQPAVEQGFAIRIRDGDAVSFRTLDRRGYPRVTFRGEYPVGRVRYRDPEVPVDVELEAFSPFIPLNIEDSSIPATLLEFTLRNASARPLEVTLAGWLENAVCHGATPAYPVTRRSVIQRSEGMTSVCSLAELLSETEDRTRPDIVFADFEGANYGEWRTEGTAFGAQPFPGQSLPSRQPVTGSVGDAMVNTHESRHGEDSERADAHIGKLTSPGFTIQRRYILFHIGGGKHAGQTGLRLVVDGNVEREATGDNGNAMRHAWFEVGTLEGRSARLEIIDTATGGWGHTTVDHVVFTDRLPISEPGDVPGFGSMALTLAGSAKHAKASTDIGDDPRPEQLFRRLDDEPVAATERSLDAKLVGALARSVSLPPGATARMTFVLSWWFPWYGQVTGEMAVISGMPKLRRHYARRFKGADAVARYVTENLTRLSEETRLWNRTWYDSTLPYWFLDRTFATADCLATQTLHAFDNGRWWGWEGVDCCPGTCQHVWQYAQAMARLFPAIERDLRERVDFGLAWHDSGAIDYRAENAREVAHDGFCGTIIRLYREHQMSADDAFLRRLWPRVRASMEYLLREDKDRDGILEGRQFNTLDAAWHGPMAWISSLYLAALAATEAMAIEMGEPEFAVRCRRVLDAGRQKLPAELFNGEYFIHRPPDFRSTNTNDGCHIDQVMGQGMAFQVGLPRIISEDEAKSALRSLWTYNFTPDIGPYREGMKPILPQGRWYAMPGEGGLLMCTWPKGGAEKAAGGGNPTFVGYFIECMTGFEYQVAAHMLWEGLVTEGLAIARTIHDRYSPAKRNPYNEVECSDHYSRAMMSYGVFLAACGFEHHGPKGFIGFSPRVTSRHFRCPFTAAEGWGTFNQEVDGNIQKARINLEWGSLRLRTVKLTPAMDRMPTSVSVNHGPRQILFRMATDGGNVMLHFDPEIRLRAGQWLEARLQ